MRTDVHIGAIQPSKASACRVILQFGRIGLRGCRRARRLISSPKHNTFLAKQKIPNRSSTQAQQRAGSPFYFDHFR
jgi:hypothetical protein